jgi:hypothetical protein
MKNYRKLLLAASAIAPLALSSWTSEDPDANYKNIESQNIKSSIGDIGTATVSKNFVFSKKVTAQHDDAIVGPRDIGASSKLATDLEPSLSFDDVLKNYK